MLDFAAKAFRSWMNVLLYLLLIGCALGGYVVGGKLSEFNEGYALLGLIIGSLIGLITVIIPGGLIANFLSMVDNIEKLAKGNLSSEVSNDESGGIYTAITDTAIRGSPDHDAYIEKTLKVGDTVYFNNFYKNDHNWFYVNTEDSKMGWCFIKHFKKC